MIMARNEDGTYSQVGFVKDNVGIDTEYIYDKDGDIVFEKGFTRETSGTVPLTINGIGKDLKDWSITGNTVQNGTPTPDNPIMPQGTGERTGNLYPLDASKLHVGRIENDGTIDYETGTLTVGPGSVTYEANEAWRGFYTDFIQVNEKEKLTFSSTNSTTVAGSCSCYDENDNFLGKATVQSTASTRTFTLLTGTKKVRVSVTSSDTTYTILRPMLNTGSTALPYEPYGYKIPVVTRGKNLTNKNSVSSVGWALNVTDLLLSLNSLDVGTYVFSANVELTKRDDTSDSSTFGASFMIEKFALGSRVSWEGSPVGTVKQLEFSFTVTEERKGKFTQAYLYGCGINGVGRTGLACFFDIQVEAGDAATPYEPYHEPITTPIYLPTPLYSGEVMRSDGSREVKFDKLVLTGEEEITSHKPFADGTISIRIPSLKAKSNSIIYCTHLQNVSFAELYNNEKQGISAHLKNELNNLYCLISGFTNLTQYKDFFRNEYSAGTPIILWYQLAEPITETFITPQIPTLSGTTVIDVDTAVKPTEMYIKYKSSK